MCFNYGKQMEEVKFTYESFDRQVENLLAMAGAVINGWEDYSSMEMNLDLRSLRIKAAKVCFMADEDHALQVGDIAQERSEANSRLYMLVNDFIEQHLGPFVKKVVEKIRDGKGMSGTKHGMFSHNISAIMPRIAELLDSACANNIMDIVDTTAKAEKIMQKKGATQQGMTDMERFWMLYELFALMCYLLLHFHTMHRNTDKGINPDDIGRLLLSAIQQYAESEEGKAALTLLLESLRFDHDGVLSAEILKEARIALRKEVPEQLQLCFMQHINDIDALGRNLLEIKGTSAGEIKTFITIVAKWMMLTHELEDVTRPRTEANGLPNSVFHDMLYDKRISMKDLRQRIERMLRFITHKNDWFCLWSVLSYHNLIKDKNTEAFARQMLSPQWFGKHPGVLTFTGDTLREYSGYFTDSPFTTWDKKSYDIYREVHHKSKWGATLCNRFVHVCYDMDEVFREP